MKNSTFSISRFSNLYVQFWFENKRSIYIYLGAVAAICLLVTSFFIAGKTGVFQHLNLWEGKMYFQSFITTFVSIGVVYSGLAFAGFRSKEKSFRYLLIPVTIVEKYLFELVNRIVLFIVGFPIFYWTVINTVGFVTYQFDSDFSHYYFSLTSIFTFLEGWQRGFLFSGIILLFVVPFTGATFFQKFPLLPTLASTLVFTTALFLFSYGLSELLELKSIQYDPQNRRLFNLLHRDNIFRFLCISAILTNFFLLAISYFKIKEKEV